MRALYGFIRYICISRLWTPLWTPFHGKKWDLLLEYLFSAMCIEIFKRNSTLKLSVLDNEVNNWIILWIESQIRFFSPLNIIYQILFGTIESLINSALRTSSFFPSNTNNKVKVIKIILSFPYAITRAQLSVPT